MQIVVVLADGQEIETLPTEIADVDRIVVAQRLARELHAGLPVTLTTCDGQSIIPAELMKTALVHILW